MNFSKTNVFLTRLQLCKKQQYQIKITNKVNRIPFKSRIDKYHII